MYPFLDIDRLSHELLQRKRGIFLEDPPSSSLCGEQIEIIAFLVLAIVSSFEGSKAVEITNPLVEKAFTSTIPKIYLGPPSLSDLTLLILVVSQGIPLYCSLIDPALYHSVYFSFSTTARRRLGE